MGAIASIVQSTLVLPDMQLKIEQQQTAVKLNVIPPEYRNVTLPGHDVYVEKGDFGIMISQWLRWPEYSICACHFDFKEESWVEMQISECCTAFLESMEGTPLMFTPGGSMPIVVQIREMEMTEITFNEVTSAFRLHYAAGFYVSLHICVPHRHMYLLKDTDWVFQKLEEYGKMIYHNKY
ncbi:hypothetical protein J2T02_002608 [Chitinophaga terrae (ex Kim and Jung 2007)]|uniref:hypothetical protein n=1 Tax=Chitinophaga terrae (ex Kim and Jung 2007) TaxID=408074 RepID=UPI002785FA83|nr:hypothetical protein [Chitinophaga terrae (ex Kim and Jung 2007)]MDQ0107489.1 hypothetical protein [Chitinophaga terrae (ex Kim and Jung 2007)]